MSRRAPVAAPTPARTGQLMSLAGLIGRPVLNPNGSPIGRLADVVVHWEEASGYPPVTGVVAKVGRRQAFVPAEGVARLARDEIRLSTAQVDLRDFHHRPGEVALARDVLDHQLVDVAGVKVVRASDLYLAHVGHRLLLVGADVGFHSLVRRLGPARWRDRPTPGRVIDWAAVQPFSTDSGEVRVAHPNAELHRLRPAELADLVEGLGRVQRQELLDSLDPEVAADVLEEMEAEDVGSVLRDAETPKAAALVAAMEPDEAAEALRDLEEDEREELLGAMRPEVAAELTGLLEHEQGTAGSVMTSHRVLAGPEETVGALQDRLRLESAHWQDLDAVLVVDEDGVLIDDISLFELLIADPGAELMSLTGPPWPLTVTTDAALDQVVERFIDSRDSSIVVVDEAGRPVGRILADDLVDALARPARRSRFPRILQ